MAKDTHSFEEASIVSASAQAQAATRITYSYGAVTGTMETLAKRRGPKFILYDLLFDRPIRCFLRTEQIEQLNVRDIWGKMVTVSGMIGRDRSQGHVVRINDITDIAVLPGVPPGSYKRARGVLADRAGVDPPEDRIRRLRDTW